jgi:hypothetical protein
MKILKAICLKRCNAALMLLLRKMDEIRHVPMPGTK